MSPAPAAPVTTSVAVPVTVPATASYVRVDGPANAARGAGRGRPVAPGVCAPAYGARRCASRCGKVCGPAPRARHSGGRYGWEVVGDG